MTWVASGTPRVVTPRLQVSTVTDAEYSRYQIVRL